MSDYLIQRMSASRLISMHPSAEIDSLHGDTHLERLTWVDSLKGTRQTRVGRNMFVLVGGTPNTAWLHHQVKLDHDGFVCTGAAAGVIRPHETSCPGMLVVGDVRAGSVKRVASAAGEGSVLIAEIHQHLAAQSEPVLIHPNRREDYPGTMHDLMSPG